MSDKARAYAISRLASCDSLEALKRVWQSFGITYQKDAEVHRFKETMKEKLSCRR